MKIKEEKKGLTKREKKNTKNMHKDLFGSS
jgi:hypothetical protein